jgi:hypothetical protein
LVKFHELAERKFHELAERSVAISELIKFYYRFGLLV